ncbi:hypothetical protein V8D89_007980 [Ganoderma adspersum]
MAADLTLMYRSPSPPRRTGKEESDLDVASRWTVPRAEPCTVLCGTPQSLPSLHRRCLAETISMVAISFRLRDEREGTHRVPTVAKMSIMRRPSFTKALQLEPRYLGSIAVSSKSAPSDRQRCSIEAAAVAGIGKTLGPSSVPYPRAYTQAARDAEYTSDGVKVRHRRNKSGLRTDSGGLPVYTGWNWAKPWQRLRGWSADMTATSAITLVLIFVRHPNDREPWSPSSLGLAGESLGSESFRGVPGSGADQCELSFRPGGGGEKDADLWTLGMTICGLVCEKPEDGVQWEVATVGAFKFWCLVSWNGNPNPKSTVWPSRAGHPVARGDCKRMDGRARCVVAKWRGLLGHTAKRDDSVTERISPWPEQRPKRNSGDGMLCRANEQDFWMHGMQPRGL